MKMARVALVSSAAISILALASCEWESSGNSGSWNESRDGWVNFSGTYRSTAGTVTITNGIPGGGGGTTGLLAEQKNEIVAIGNGSLISFAGTLSQTPVYVGSILITDDNESFVDGNGDGTLEPSHVGASGQLDYNTGGFVVKFALSPIMGRQIKASYLYHVTDGSSGGETVTDAGGKEFTISRLVADHTGNKLTLTDNNGYVYSGRMYDVKTTTGERQTTGTVIAKFQVVGPDGIKMVGTFQGEYAAAATEGEGTGATETTASLVNRTMNGTWKNAYGASGSLTFRSF